MVKTLAHTMRTGVVLSVACMAAIGTFSLSACGATPQERELQGRGFENVVRSDEIMLGEAYYGSVGGCRVHLTQGVFGSGWKGQIGDDTIDEPTAAMIRADHRFDFCSKS